MRNNKKQSSIPEYVVQFGCKINLELVPERDSDK